MVRLAIDENFNNDILRGVLRRNPNLDATRVQDARLRQANDPAVLAWAAKENRVLFSHDVSTMTKYALMRVKAGQRMPGLFEVGRAVPLRQAIEDLLLIAECSREGEWEGQIHYLPL